MNIQEELDQMRDAHRRTALQFVCQLLREDSALTRGQLLFRASAPTCAIVSGSSLGAAFSASPKSSWTRP